MSTILLINKFFYPKGGSETYFFSTLHELEKRGHTVIPFSMQDDQNLPSEYSPYFAPHISFDSGRSLSKAKNFIYSQDAAHALEKLLERVRPDIAHVHNFAHQLTPSILRVLRDHNIPIVYTAHDYQLICPSYSLYTQNAPCERCHVFKYWNAVTHRCVQDAALPSALAALEMTVNRTLTRSYDLIDRIIAPSQFMREMLLRWKYLEEKVVYIPHGVEMLRLTRPEHRSCMLYVGRLTKEKGIRTLLHAIARTEYTLRIIGTGPEEESLRQEVQKLNIADRVIFMGACEQVVVRKAMTEAQAVVVPSEWYENAPMVIYEALALGTPVIGSHIGGIPELIIEGKNGYTYTSKDVAGLVSALQRIRQIDIDKMPKFQYSNELHLNRLEALYTTLLS